MTRKEVIEKSLQYYIFECNYKFSGKQQEDEIAQAKKLLKDLGDIEPTNSWVCSNSRPLEDAFKWEYQYLNRCKTDQEVDTNMSEIRDEKTVLFQFLGIINDFRQKLSGSVNIDI